MEIENQAPVKVMYTTVKTTLKDIQQYVGKTPMELKAECDKLGIATNNLQHWVYTDASGDPNKEFILDICLEVDREASSDKFQFQELPEFKCVTTIHNGSWNELVSTYEKFFNEIYGNNLKPTNKVRGVYRVVDFENPNKNVTEIQVGIA